MQQRLNMDFSPTGKDIGSVQIGQKSLVTQPVQPFLVQFDRTLLAHLPLGPFGGRDTPRSSSV